MSARSLLGEVPLVCPAQRLLVAPPDRGPEKIELPVHDFSFLSVSRFMRHGGSVKGGR
jgi:hypothetical protein